MGRLKDWIETHSQCDVCKGYIPDYNWQGGVILCSPECEKEMREVMEASADEKEE